MHRRTAPVPPHPGFSSLVVWTMTPASLLFLLKVLLQKCCLLPSSGHALSLVLSPELGARLWSSALTSFCLSPHLLFLFAHELAAPAEVRSPPFPLWSILPCPGLCSWLSPADELISVKKMSPRSFPSDGSELAGCILLLPPAGHLFPSVCSEGLKDSLCDALILLRGFKNISRLGSCFPSELW